MKRDAVTSVYLVLLNGRRIRSHSNDRICLIPILLSSMVDWFISMLHEDGDEYSNGTGMGPETTPPQNLKVNLAIWVLKRSRIPKRVRIGDRK